MPNKPARRPPSTKSTSSTSSTPSTPSTPSTLTTRAKSRTRRTKQTKQTGRTNSALPSPVDRAKFRRRLLTWYGRFGRDLPWRKTTDPYHILVSEIMLQQTQVDRVLPKYEEWLTKYPSLDAL